MGIKNFTHPFMEWICSDYVEYKRSNNSAALHSIGPNFFCVHLGLKECPQFFVMCKCRLGWGQAQKHWFVSYQPCHLDRNLFCILHSKWSKNWSDPIWPVSRHAFNQNGQANRALNTWQVNFFHKIYPIWILILYKQSLKNSKLVHFGPIGKHPHLFKMA